MIIVLFLGFEQLVQKLLTDSESKVHEKMISNACEHSEGVVKVHNSLNQYKFSRDMLTSFKVTLLALFLDI